MVLPNHLINITSPKPIPHVFIIYSLQMIILIRTLLPHFHIDPIYHYGCPPFAGLHGDLVKEQIY